MGSFNPIQKSINPDLIDQWAQLLQPIHFKSSSDTNIHNQIMYLKILANFCIDRNEKGVFPYQKHLCKLILENQSKFFLKFGTAKVDGALRPYIYFCRPDNWTKQQFIDHNPLLGEIHDTNYMTQHNNQKAQYDLIFDVHSMTEKYNNITFYVDYICAVVNLYACMCTGGNNDVIERLANVGLSESHVSLILHKDTKKLVVHEKFKAAYCYLARAIYIENDSIVSSIEKKNRCYVWDRIQEKFEVKDRGFSQNNFNDLVINDEYAGKSKAKIVKLDDPSQPMIVLTEDQKGQNKMVISLIKQSVVWFFQQGPTGTNNFFYHNPRRNFMPQSLQIKMESVKTFLNTIEGIVSKDFMDEKFIIDVSLICTCVLYGSLNLPDTEDASKATFKKSKQKSEIKITESSVPLVVRSNWIYNLMWISKTICKTNPGIFLEKHNQEIEGKTLDILDKLVGNRLNTQCLTFLSKFRQFQETSLDNIAQRQDGENEIVKVFNVQTEFESIFKQKDLDSDHDQIAQTRKLQHNIMHLHMELCKQKGCLIGEFLKEYEMEESSSKLSIKSEIMLNYIFNDDTKQPIRRKALEVMIKEFNQKELLVNELMKTSLIVSNDDYYTHIKILMQQRDLKTYIQSMLHYEVIWSIETDDCDDPTSQKENVLHIKKIVQELGNDIKGFDEVKKRRFQNIVRNIGLIEQLKVLMIKLKDKMFYYRELYQEIINLFYIVCFNNPMVQSFFIQDLNFFVDMINNRIETGILISEVIKSNLKTSDTYKFIKFLVNKIIEEGYFKSTLFYLLMKLARGQSNDTEGQIKRNQDSENANQQYIMKQIVKNSRFRQMIYMQKEQKSTKLGIIKQYSKKLDIAKGQHNENSCLRDKELLDMHLAVIDLVSICSKNSPYGVSQAQKLINCEELLDSILSDSIPYLVKRHYFNLLFEVYLRKVPGISKYERLSVKNLKLQSVFKWVICWDLDQCYNHYSGLVIDAPLENNVEENKRFRQANREVQRLCETEFEEKFISKTDQDRQEEQVQRAKLQAYKEDEEQFFLDNSDLTEYWRYLYETTEAEGSLTGLLSFVENYYKDYTKIDFDDNIEAQKSTLFIKQKLLELASNIFLIQDSHDSYIKFQSQQILVQINKSVQQMPNFHDFPQLQHEIDVHLSSLASQHVDNRMCGDLIIVAICDYILKENIPIREALGISFISSENTMVSKESLKKEIKLICGSGATFDEVVKGLDHFHDVSLARKQLEAGQLDYIVKEEVGLDLIDIVDIEIRLREELAKDGQNADTLGKESARILDTEEAIHDQDISNAINIDLKLFCQRFFEFVRGTKNFSEIHSFVHDLMNQEHLKDRESKVKFIRNICDGFSGVSGDNDELVLISILSLIIQRLIPDEEDSLQASNQTLLFVKKNKKHNDRLKDQLNEWQNIMFEAEVPALMLSFINIKNNTYLSNKALGLLNLILIRTNETNQKKIVQLLKKDDSFFDVFYYLMTRMQASKEFMLQQIQNSAESKFMGQNLQKKKKGSDNKQNDFQSPNHLLNIKYDLEFNYRELKSVWQQEEMYEILKFLNQICEGCFEPAQLFLGRQVNDEENFKDQKKITSIDLVYEVQRTFIDIVDTMGDYVFSDFRTFKLIPLMMDTMLEFIYGPCIRNQVFLGESKKFISVINTLIDQSEMGNYSGIHQQAKAQLVILSSCTQLLLAICDIKDPDKAQRTHQIILNEINIPNLIKKMKEIYIYRIGGDPEKQMIYDFNLQCNHFKTDEDHGKSRCLENEFCEFKHLIPRDINTIQTGFNIYMILTILKNHNPDRKEIKIFHRNEGVYSSLVQKQGKELRNRIYEKYKMSSEKTKNIYERFNKIEVVLLDQMIIKSFPELYITYIEKQIEEQKEDPNQNVDYQLKSNLDKAKACKNKFDQQQILKKLPVILRKNYTDGQTELSYQHYKALDQKEVSQSNYGESEILLKDMDSSKDEVSQKVVPINQQNQILNNQVYNKNVSFYEEQIENQIKKEEQQKFEENVKLLEFYLAGNFYEDNISTVEIQLEQIEGKETYSSIAKATFQVPSFIKHLTQESREQITTALCGVSQQEKLECFVSTIPKLLIEMKWQQKLGRVSYALKIFANQWQLLSWINFYIICFINVMLISFFTVEPVEQGRDESGNQVIKDEFKIPNEQINEIVNDIGLIQTSVAGIVVIAYYIEYRAKIKYMIQESKQQTNIDLQGYGVTYGSQGYGNRKSGKMNDIKSEQFLEVNPLRGIENKSVFFKLIMIFTKEISMFVKAIQHDSTHVRNLIYVLIAILSSIPNAQIAYAILLLDLIKKVKTLGQVILVITDNAVALGSTLVLFVVLLYLYSFFAFTYVRDDYMQNTNTGSNFYQNHAPVSPGGTYNMNCQTLTDCFFSTTSFGMRSGGGVGDALWQRFISDEFYSFRYIFDFSFFMIINIILMNIFFGIIIDSFADKRQGAADIDQEVQGQCFICGITKSKFEIENVPWHDHIYTEHNLHGYLSFIIYVQQKNMSECSGVEKWVKRCLNDDNIEFFPVQKCLSINNGEEIE